MEMESKRKLAIVVAAAMGEQEAAPYCGVSVYSLRRWRVYGGGPVYRKVGSRVVYLQADLDEFLASCLRRSTSDPGPAVKTDQEGGQGAKVRKLKALKEPPAPGFSSQNEGKGGAA
jgi:hypothetical protein